MIHLLAAKTVRNARTECRARWPDKLVKLKGFAAFDHCTYISFVRPIGDKAPVATATENRGPKPIEFYAEPQ